MYQKTPAATRVAIPTRLNTVEGESPVTISVTETESNISNFNSMLVFSVPFSFTSRENRFKISGESYGS